MQKILIIGATSAIAESVARRYAQRASALHLVARSESRLGVIAADLLTRGAAGVTTSVLDVADVDAHAAMLEDATRQLGQIDVALIAHGTLPSQSECDADLRVALREFHINGTATIALAHQLAPRLKSGASIAVISSVAGDRGRASNYLYGSAKAAVTAYLSGLSQRLHGEGINVLTIKPGFVDTPMTATFKKGPLWASADTVAQGIVKAIDRRRPVAYLPGFWWLIMQVIKNIPERIFQRIRL
jgi:decaprenylphospho-beta-D-erythro-pentofuranosid-2-ulose 2-reductase